jgi:hypothetical protein
MSKPMLPSPIPPAARAAHSAALGLRRLLRGTPRVRLDGSGAYTSLLRIEGTFRPGWLGSLAAGIAEHGISIVQGHAESDLLGGWTAELVLARSPTGALPSRLDFVALADRDVLDYSGPRVELSIGSASSVPDHGGSLLVIVEGKDQIGFLATLLTRLAKVQLHPVELAIATTAGTVADRLWLRAAGNRAPGPDALRDVSLALHPVTRGAR